MNEQSCPGLFTWKSIAAALIAAILSLGSRMAALADPPINIHSINALPPDLPLPASPPLQETWLREANILQPYGHSAFIALTDIKDRPARLKKEFGFNTIIVQPPDSHNTIALPADKLTEKQFANGIAAYRAAGYRILLYTSVMALGLSPEFQSGQISREHPDWLQRDPKGNPVLMWNVPWLCPSTGARQVALDRCLRIARKYEPDGIMLDNNEFFFAAAGWTCHCDACEKAFRQYVQKRFGNDKAEKLFGAAPEHLEIPIAEGALYFEWLHWRNRIWADVNECFRARLRQQNPAIMLFANTQYGYDNGMLGTDQQYAREDVVLSESCDLNARQMSAKMVLGKAVAEGRPLWNYIGTFAKPDDYTGLRLPELIGPAIAATLAHNARPWIVDGFDEGPTYRKSCEVMSKLLKWQANHKCLFAGKPFGTVAAVVSPESRNVLHTLLIPPHVPALQSAGIPVIALRDDTLTADQLRPFKILTIETAGCLPTAAAAAIAEWVLGGGTLAAAPDVGFFDELGRKHTDSTLWKALHLHAAPGKKLTVGNGAVIAQDNTTFAGTTIDIAQPLSFLMKPNSGAEVVAYTTADSLLMHIIQHERPSKHLELHVPKLFSTTSSARLFTPDSVDAQFLPVDIKGDGASLVLPGTSLYCVVEIPLR
jgi:hypothetical protein